MHAVVAFRRHLKIWQALFEIMAAKLPEGVVVLERLSH